MAGEWRLPVGWDPGQGVEQGGDLGGGDGAAEVITLGPVATEALEPVGLLGVLDSLCDHLQPEAAAQLDDGCGQRVPALAGAVDERLVDLQNVDRELLQITERRVPGAEVVE